MRVTDVGIQAPLRETSRPLTVSAAARNPSYLASNTQSVWSNGSALNRID